MIIVTGSLIAKENQFDAALKQSLAHVHRSRLEEGCLMFSVNIDAENPNRLVFIGMARHGGFACALQNAGLCAVCCAD
jgi:quinol monooxygenase YgiN